MITERQEKILNTIVQEYIISAQPVSSQLVEKRHNFGICPATIRIEMQRLTEAGFIFQPHTSAGRLPTDKGYRFFVDDLFENRAPQQRGEGFEAEDWIGKEITDSIKFLQFITKKLSLISSNLALGYLFDEKILWKDGWEEIIKEPEFEEKKVINDFIEMINGFEEEIDDLEISSDIKVYIGRENPFPKAKEFSIIITRCLFPKKDYNPLTVSSRSDKSERAPGILAILGPKRMDYNKNIGSLNSLIKLLEKV